MGDKAMKEINPVELVKQILREVREDICDNYCKYRDTVDEENLCDAIRNGEKCPLDRLI